MITTGNQIEFRHLRYFMAVAEELHFRRAADKLFISQPGLSRQIAQMEESLQVQLFTRDKKKVSLTPAGQYFYKELEAIFNTLHYTMEQLKYIDNGEEGELRISFVGSAMQNVIPDALLKLSERHPNIHTLLHEMPNWDQVEALLHHKTDVGFVRLQHVPEGLSLLPVFTDTFSLVVPEHHPVTRRFSGLADLKDEPFILFSSDYSSGYYDQVMSIFEENGFAPKISHRSVHANTIFRLVENSLGVAIVPSSLQHGFSLRIKFIPLTGIKQRATLSVIWRKADTNRALQNFLKLLVENKVEGGKY